MDYDLEEFTWTLAHDPNWPIGYRPDDPGSKPVDQDSWINKDWQNQDSLEGGM